ncbi:UPF0280 family protein [Rhodoplanes sp. TEM]|uniref:UPF0280 family protein n=1 Tax=Rhodoplanes tepidamans TaxID=200616 RepID=A0ABT5JGE8_RHOTP|nr:MULTISPECIES: UPF0280 family protein [Rhodoplanes]MDC7788359.1 UPF0280 family protein [Rhodoplanes tepidamans]MDC7986101.1 UPF0280 family protein [Rhodoplanes sp. TEM]MDQ0358840.1 ApbE superfamily uncharacterized protein (UPF0280 family) [Rhodoplanes tepidamans]
MAAAAVAASGARRPHARMLPDGRRLHLQDGPIDLIVEAFGPRDVIETAYRAAARRLTGLLDDLCGELATLRRPVGPTAPAPLGPVGRRMAAAVRPFADETFITPMAAVAGSVADEILAAMTAAAGDALARAYVNNGGDIALHLSPGTRLTTGLVDRPDRPTIFATAAIEAADPVRGIATSGAGGRSFSLGIADAVTILARDAASADAAATVVANAVDIAHPGIVRLPARELQPDSDLGDRLVTRAVPPLARPEIDAALDRGAAAAAALRERGLIVAAALHLQGTTRTAGPLLQPEISDLSRQSR